VGDVVSEKDKADLAFRLGEIYFSDLKSYAAAAKQFGNALEAGMSGDRAGEALLKRAKSPGVPEHAGPAGGSPGNRRVPCLPRVSRNGT